MISIEICKLLYTLKLDFMMHRIESSRTLDLGNLREYEGGGCSIKYEYTDGISVSTISFKFLGIIMRFLRLEVSTFISAFLQNAF